MPAFEYEALDPSGKKTKGIVSADSAQLARRELRHRSLAPLSVIQSTSSSSSVSKSLLSSRQPRLTTKELMLFTRQLATLVSASIPLEEALGLIANQSDTDKVRRIIMAIRSRISEGEKLADAMGEFPDSFENVYIETIAAGEGSGGLPKVLERLAQYLEQSEALRRRISVAMIYPGVLAALAVIVISILMIFVVPRIAEQFTSLDSSLPLLTEMMIAISSFFQTFWIYLLVGGLGLYFLFEYLLRNADIRARWDGFVLSIPMIGSFVKKVESARFARTMSILIEGGSVLPDAMKASRKAAGRAPFRDRLGQMIEEVEEGASLSDTMNASGWFPSLMLYMVAAGERSGRLDEMFARSADHLESEVDGSVNTGLNLLEPGIIAVLGFIVMMIVLSILLPILRLNTLAAG